MINATCKRQLRQGHNEEQQLLLIIRDVTEPAKIRIRCGFHVQNPSDADLSCD